MPTKFREIVRAVLEKNAEMTDIEGKRQGRSNLGWVAVLAEGGVGAEGRCSGGRGGGGVQPSHG